MSSELAYPKLANKTILVVESPQICIPLIGLLASNGGMRGILVPELFFSDDLELLSYLKQSNKAEFSAVHVPGVGAEHIASIRVEQVAKLPINKTVVLKGFSVNTETSTMFETIASMGYAVIEKNEYIKLLQLLSSMV
jgi:hypothetical protein